MHTERDHKTCLPFGKLLWTQKSQEKLASGWGSCGRVYERLWKWDFVNSGVFLPPPPIVYIELCKVRFFVF